MWEVFEVKRFILGLLIVGLAGGAFGWWWASRPLELRHPNFGADCSALTAEASVEARVECVRVWYGTNRKLETSETVDGELNVESGSGEDGEALRLGRADIWLPRLTEDGGSRKRGETPHIKGTPPEDATKLADYVFLTRITTTGRGQFSMTLQEAVDANGSDSALLFVHGFNVEFDAALVRAAQLSVDLSRAPTYDVGTPVLFSWPSVGKVSLEDYSGDRDRSLAAAPYLESFLDILTEDLEVSRINIVAHSMGNRILTKALEDYASDYLTRHDRDDLEFRIILVAADVERDIFDAANGVFDNLDANITIYTSDTDRALHVSTAITKDKRLGDTDKDKPYIRRDERYETVDATAITTELFGLGHSYYSDNPTILWDMMCTIGETDPQDRALEEATYAGLPDGDPYFRISTSVEPNYDECSVFRESFPLTAIDEAPLQAPTAPALERPAPPPPMASPQGVQKPDTRGLDPAPMPISATLLITDFNDTDLSPYTDVLQSAVNDGVISQITLFVHTDTVGTSQDNLVKSERLAQQLKNWLIRQGVELDRITATGMGEAELAIVTEDETPLAENNRIEVTITYAN